MTVQHSLAMSVQIVSILSVVLTVDVDLAILDQVFGAEVCHIVSSVLPNVNSSFSAYTHARLDI